MLQELIKFNDDIILCEQESLANILMNNHEDFKKLYDMHNEEINQVILQIDHKKK